MKRSKKLLSFVACLVLLASLLVPLAKPLRSLAESPPLLSDVGQTWDPIPITTCQELQGITNNLDASYVLVNNIDCSDTVNWNSGQGFIPIGQIPNSNNAFAGILNGQGFSIDNLYINHAIQPDATGAGLFFASNKAILHLTLNNPTIIGRTNQSEDMGAVAGQANGSITDVHVVNATITASGCSDGGAANVGGLIGTDYNVLMTRSSSSGNITISGPDCGSARAGGLAGEYDNGSVTDSYSKMDIAVSSTAAAGCTVISSCTRVGGIFASNGGGSTASIQNSYAAGSVQISNGSGANLDCAIGGLVGANLSGGPTITVTNSFVATQYNLPGCSANALKDPMVGYSTELTTPDYSTGYYDQTATGLASCYGGCRAVNTAGNPQPNYFRNNSSSAPLDQWNFSTVWSTSSGFPVLRSQINPEPGAVQNLTSSINSTTAIDLDWTLPTNTGSAPISGEVIYVQKAGDTTWQALNNLNLNLPENNLVGTHYTVKFLLPATNYSFKVVFYNRDGYSSTAAGITGVTATPGVVVITNCHQLQDISNDLGNNYELARDIGCSDTVNWNGGQGFIPIGYDNSTGQWATFIGVLEGNNYTISNIFIKGYGYGGGALFLQSQGALVQDFNIVNPKVGAASGGLAVVSDNDSNSTFKNIHVSGIFDGVTNQLSSGMIGYASGTHIEQSSFVGDVTYTEQSEIFGGLVQSGQDVSITNSYVQASIHLNSTGIDSSALIGGLVGQLYGNSTISNSYASLNIVVAPDAVFVITPEIGGLVSSMAGSLTVSSTHNFAVTNLSAEPTFDRAGLGGLIGSANSFPSVQLDLSGNYFDADALGTSACMGYLNDSYSHDTATCNTVSGQPNYFNNNSSNPPLNSWDFNNIWQITSNLPVFGRKALTTITPIPASRLVTKKPATPGTAANVIKVASVPGKISALPRDHSQQAATQSTPPAPQGIIAQLKQLLGHVPVAVLVSFPYILFGLLLLAALALLIEMLRQANRLQKLNLLLAEQRSVADKRDTFWHLAANYLRAPITLLMGGTDLLTLNKEDTTETKQLTVLSQRLQTKVANIMQSIEKSHTLQGIKAPQKEKPYQVWRSAGFWIPLLTVALLVILTNYVAHAWRNLQVDTISLVSQALVYLMVAVLLYWAMSGFGLASRRRRNAEQLLQRQERALDTARLHLMRQTATDLDSDVSHLQTVLAKLPAASQAKPIIQEGASRLRHLVDSFQLLISAQNHCLGGLSPAGIQTSLDSVLKASLAELEPEITARHLTVNLPAKQGLRVPGSPDLNSQVISSVLANAVAFSRSGSKIELALDQNNEGVSLSVLDQGPGIAPSQQAHLFEPFTKADGQTGLQLDHDGLGISLYLDRQIMDYLGGQVLVHSQAGQGTAVELQWPHGKQTYPGMVVHPAT
jgi:signal transduction histidine kinase